MTFDEMSAAVSNAETTLRIADRMADRLANMLVGRLRHVASSYVLQRLKMELRGFNAHTGRWTSKEG